MRLKMLTSLAGHDFSLAPGDEHDFTDTKEAKRLIDAGYAVSAVPETPEQRVARLTAELEAATKAAAKA